MVQEDRYMLQPYYIKYGDDGHKYTIHMGFWKHSQNLLNYIYRDRNTISDKKYLAITEPRDV